MTYSIAFSDPAKSGTPILVYDGVMNTGATSLSLPGRNYPGYGQALNTDLVHLLENFSSSTPPVNPIEGQLWYDTSNSESKVLYVNDGGNSGSTWVPVNGVYQQTTEPTNASVGNIWVDTTNMQVYVYNGSSFSPMNSAFASSSMTGISAEILTDTLGNSHNVIISYVNDFAIEIVASEAFTPNPVINGFSSIVAGVNLSTANLSSGSTSVIPQLNATANAANGLLINSAIVSASSFMRKDINQTMNGTLWINVDSNAFTVGSSATMVTSILNGYNAQMYNANSSGVFSFRFSGISQPTLSINATTQKVTVNDPTVTNASAGLQVYGSVNVTSSSTFNTVYVTSTASNYTTIAGNAMQVTGGVGIAGTLVVNGEHVLKGPLTVGSTTIVSPSNTTTSLIVPTTDATYDIGDTNVGWRNIYVDYVLGSSNGSATLVGVASYANYLTTSSNMVITGDVSTSVLSFNGGGSTLSFATTAQPAIMTSKVTTSTSTGTDMLLLYSTSQGNLYNQSKRSFLQDINYYDSTYTAWNTGFSTPSGSLVPVGTIIECPGIVNGSGTVPAGWLNCTGTNISSTGYTALKNWIGTKFDPNNASYLLPNISKSISTTTTIGYIIKY